MRIRYTNYKKEYPNRGIGAGCFTKWFFFTRYWGGKLICMGIKHHQITIDVRGDLYEELTGKKAV